MVLRRSRAEWGEHVAAWRQSGLPAAEYARQHGLNVNTFSWWRSQLGREGADDAERLTLLPLNIPMAAERTPSTAVEVVLPHGIVVRVPDVTAPSRVADLVRALVTSC